MTGRHRATRRRAYRGRDQHPAPAALAEPVPALALPYAAQLQGHTTMGDLGLLAGARLRHDRIRWWWGERKIDGWHGAWCYLCDRAIVSWDTRYPITQEAQASIIAAREWHLLHGLAPHGMGAPAKSAGAQASPVGGSS